ncbi:unnamed protein product, partial [Vitis vinifera]
MQQFQNRRHTSDSLLNLPINILASPKSPSLALKSESNIISLDLISLCTTHCSHSSCRYTSKEAKPKAIPYLIAHVNKVNLFLGYSLSPNIDI